MGVILKDWLESDINNEDFSNLLFNMSTTMKYVHNKGYYIKKFDLDEIEIMDEEKLTPIRYNTVVRFDNEDRKDIVRRDIYNLAFIAIGTYSGTLNYLKPDFLKENFDEFINFLPNGDIPYYRGIIERGSSVYYSDYVIAKSNREIEKLDNVINNNQSNGQYGFKKKKTTNIGSAMTDKSTERLYNKLDNNQSAFTSFLILPFAMIFLGIILGIIMLFS